MAISDSPIGAAVVGCGLFGSIHAATYARFEQTRLVLVCDLDEKRAKKLADEHGCDYTTRVEDVTGHADIQLASVVTPDFTHREPCIALAKAGKHFIVEKPLATSSADAQAILDAAAEARIVAGVDFHNRYHPAMRRAKDRLVAGKLGEPRMILARLSDRIEVATQWFGWSSKSGPEWFLGPHIADLTCWLMDQAPTRVFADATRGVLSGQGVDCYDCMQIHLTFPRGMATLETSWILPDTWPSVADFSLSLQTTTNRVDVHGVPQGMIEAGPEDYSWPHLNGMTPIGEDDFGYFHLPIRDFVRAVQRGGPPPTTLDEALLNVRIIEAAVESAQTGRVVELAAV